MSSLPNLAGYKTTVFAILFIVVGLAGQFGFVEYQPSEGVTELLAVLVGALMFVLRYFTDTPVFYKK